MKANHGAHSFLLPIFCAVALFGFAVHEAHARAVSGDVASPVNTMYGGPQNPTGGYMRQTPARYNFENRQNNERFEKGQAPSMGNANGGAGVTSTPAGAPQNQEAGPGPGEQDDQSMFGCGTCQGSQRGPETYAGQDGTAFRPDTPPYESPTCCDGANAPNTANTAEEKRASTEFGPGGGLPLTAARAGEIVATTTEQDFGLANNPEGQAAQARSAQQAQSAQNADNQGKCGQENCEQSFECMKLALINVANENAATPTSPYIPFKTYSQAIWMVQQMYHKCYVPMAILFLLPGAILTQVKGLVAYGILGSQDEDTTSPLTGIFRSVLAVFLIPATQLVVSYCIDIGNALTYPVAERVQVGLLMEWVKEQAFSCSPSNMDGCTKNLPGGQMMGKLMNTSAKSCVQERQSDLSVQLQNMLNTVNAMLSQGLEILNGFQLVMMCYLFLLGPIAASFYAWPSGIGRDLFKKCFAGWLDGVIVLSLWKFWWCIILLIMVTRLQEGVDPTDQFELYFFTAFMGILVMVPFQPFDFKPGEIVSHVLEKAQQQAGGGGGGGGGGGAGGGCGSGGAAAGSGGEGQTQASQSSNTASTGTGARGMAGGTMLAGSPDEGAVGESGHNTGGSIQVASADSDFDVDPMDDISGPPSSRA